MEQFSDDEMAFFRHVRFGELPPRVRPEELVETTDTGEPTFEPPEQVIGSQQWYGYIAY
jgi:hypothetical protein